MERCVPLICFFIILFIEEQIDIHPMLKEQVNLVLIIFYNAVSESLLLPPLGQMFLLLVLLNHLPTHLALSAISVTSHCVRDQVLRLDRFLAIWTHYWLHKVFFLLARLLLLLPSDARPVFVCIYILIENPFLLSLLSTQAVWGLSPKLDFAYFPLPLIILPLNP